MKKLSVFALVLFVFLLTYSHLEHNKHYPAIGDLLDNPERYNGVLVEFAGTVTKVSPNFFYLAFGDEEIKVLYKNPQKPKFGGVSVYGVFKKNGYIDALEVHVHDYNSIKYVRPLALFSFLFTFSLRTGKLLNEVLEMPDWVSHILIGLVICEIFRIRKKSLVVLGALLPDFFFKIVTLGFFMKIPGVLLYWFLIPFHTPAGAFLFTAAIIPLFRFNQRKAFFLITIGWISHFAADSMTKVLAYSSQQMLFFPFLWKSYSLHMIWPEQYYLAIIFFAAVYLVVRVVKK